MIEIKAPNRVPRYVDTVFLAGSIEMGKAENWQHRVRELLKNTNYTLVNPRRDDWDASWTQSIENPQFKEQVEWELDNILDARYVLFYFAPGTLSPISLLELGLMAGNTALALDTLVVCPDGFWRKGNVDVVCWRAGIPQFHTIEDACEEIIRRSGR